MKGHKLDAELEMRFGPLRRAQYTLSVGKRVFEDFRCREEVVLVIRRPSGRFLLHTKGFYPPGVFRLPSGSIREGESVLEALFREVHEETGLEVEIERCLGVLSYELCWRGRRAHFISYVFLLREVGGALEAQDTEELIAGFREVSPEELRDVAAKLRGLKGQWKDWGRLRALAHDLVAEEVICGSPS